MRPLIGITTSSEPDVSWGYWTAPSAFVPLSYVTAVERAGGRPLLVPPVDDGVAETLDVLDGLVLSGGNDLDPGAYGAHSHPETTSTAPQRDEAELALVTAALERDLPVLAVCRGSQILNVARGGDLVQHLPELVGHEEHRPVPGTFAEHGIALAEGTRLADVLGGDHAPVKSHHHQGYGRLGEGLREAAWAEDGTIEAVEDPSKRFALGVLWHPEEGEDARLFEALVAEASAFRAARGG
jgi:gamma-glutamyl-gamma-aminobutyrate hydrolase PuuD